MSLSDQTFITFIVCIDICSHVAMLLLKVADTRMSWKERLCLWFLCLIITVIINLRMQYAITNTHDRFSAVLTYALVVVFMCGSNLVVETEIIRRRMRD